MLLLFCRKRTDVASLLFLTPGERRLRLTHPCLRLVDFCFTLARLHAPEGSCRAVGPPSPCAMHGYSGPRPWASFTTREAWLLLSLAPSPAQATLSEKRAGGLGRLLRRRTTRPGWSSSTRCGVATVARVIPPFPTRGSSSSSMSSSMRLTFGLEARREPRARLALGP